MTPLRRSTQAGRRGVTRNLVGRESVARVRIPSPPPKNPDAFASGFFGGGEGIRTLATLSRPTRFRVTPLRPA